MPIPLISTIIAKLMMIIELVLEQFALVDEVGVSTDACGSFIIMNVTPTACGIDFAEYVGDVVVGVTRLIPQILAGIGAAEVRP